MSLEKKTDWEKIRVLIYRAKNALPEDYHRSRNQIDRLVMDYERKYNIKFSFYDSPRKKDKII